MEKIIHMVNIEGTEPEEELPLKSRYTEKSQERPTSGQGDDERTEGGKTSRERGLQLYQSLLQCPAGYCHLKPHGEICSS